MIHLLLLVAVTGPLQPASGPGGKDYRHATVTQHSYGQNGTQYWLFEPADPPPASAPVIVFLHGWSAMYPRSYGHWIHHLVRRGNIVVYPRYQENLVTPPGDFTPNTEAAIKSALRELQSGQHVRPDLDRLAVVGHSMGGALTANIAAGFPAVKAAMCIEPSDGADRNPRINLPKADWLKIPATTLLLTVVGEDDKRAGDRYAKLIFRGTPQIPTENKNYIIVRTDRHGSPTLEANHMAPVASELWNRSVDALDYCGFWKLFDALTDAAFYGKNREYALGNTPEQRFMGTWSDGVAVKELTVTDQP